MDEYWLTVAIIICVATDVIMNFCVAYFVRKLTLKHKTAVELSEKIHRVLKGDITKNMESL